jgi:ELWxxDGT repeat protein
VLFFVANDGTHDQELWRSNGTAAGTFMLRDINPTGASLPEILASARGVLYFTVRDANYRPELWMTDGTVGGTMPVSSPENMTTTRSSSPIFFGGFDAGHGTELWKSDGTAGGTAMVKDIAGTDSSGPKYLTNVNGTLFFTAVDADLTRGLWKSDGTAAGTQFLTPIRTDYEPHRPDNELLAVGNTLYFTQPDRYRGWELWKSDGTPEGTVLIKDISTAPSFGLSRARPIQNLTAVGDIVFFTADDGHLNHGQELWKSDGTADGTMLVKDILAGGDGSNPHSLIDFNGELYFAASDSSGHGELWRSDGTGAGTVIVRGFGYFGYVGAPAIVVGGTLYFAAFEAGTGYELWKSDGSPNGTMLVSDIVPGTDGSYPRLFENANGRLFFWTGSEPYSSNALWITDGSAKGTVRLRSLKPIEFSDERPDVNFAAMGGNLYFAAHEAGGDTALWKSDGTVDGTSVVADVAPRWLAAAQDKLYFYAADGAHGGELWVSDGSATGTAMFVDILAGSDSASPRHLTAVNGNLFFSANDGVHGTELWVLPRTLVAGDIDFDGRRTIADISDLVNALTDLNTYQSSESLSDGDLLAIADANKDGRADNKDVQSLIVSLANSIAVSG